MSSLDDLNLSEAFDNVPWHWLRPHHEQGVLILVDPALDLEEVAGRIAADDTAAVQAWLASRLIAKPAPEQAAAWDREPARLFSIMVVQPFVLVRDMVPAGNGISQ